MLEYTCENAIRTSVTLDSVELNVDVKLENRPVDFPVVKRPLSA